MSIIEVQDFSNGLNFAQAGLLIKLADETETLDEAWAFVEFSADIIIDYCPAEYDDGYMVHGDGYELERVYPPSWHIVEMEALDHANTWTPTDEDKAKIVELIYEAIGENWTVDKEMLEDWV
jgi:hypothetical protein